MYAIIELQGSQLKLEEGDQFTVNRLKPSGMKTFKADKVLFARDGDEHRIGEPHLPGAYVECEVLGEMRGKKLIAFKYRERKSSQSKRGHRQDLTELKVKKIHLGGKPAGKKAQGDSHGT